MTTHEPEITAAVDLCTPDGQFLNPAARGWSRVPLHRANLGASDRPTQRWDYWAVLAGDFVLGSVFADVTHLGVADIWWCHLPSGRTGGALHAGPAAEFALPDIVATAPLQAAGASLSLDITDDDEVTHFVATWTEEDGRAGRAEIQIDRPAGYESLNVVIPWSETEFNFTSKQQARPARVSSPSVTSASTPAT